MAMISQGNQGEFFDELELMPVELREKYLNEKLSQAVDHAYRSAPAARELLDRAGLSPADIRTVRDLEKIPITRKTDLIELQRAKPPYGGFLAIPFEDFLSLTLVLSGIALLFADQGEVERAVELYALAATQGIVANSKWFDDIAGDAGARAAEGLPTEVAEAAKARGRALDLWETAAELVVELEEMGWESTE